MQKHEKTYRRKFNVYMKLNEKGCVKVICMCVGVCACVVCVGVCVCVCV